MYLLNTQIDTLPVEEIKPAVKTAWAGTERLLKDIRDILKYIDAPLSLSEGTPLVWAA